MRSRIGEPGYEPEPRGGARGYEPEPRGARTREPGEPGAQKNRLPMREPENMEPEPGRADYAANMVVIVRIKTRSLSVGLSTSIVRNSRANCPTDAI
jgi:hypothetical protein